MYKCSTNFSAAYTFAPIILVFEAGENQAGYDALMACAVPAQKPGSVRRFWRRRVLFVLSLLIIVFAAPVVYLLFQKLAAEAERDAIVTELDRTDPGWRTAHQPLGPQVTAEGNSLGEIVRAAHLLIPTFWGSEVAFEEVDNDIPPFRLTDAAQRALKGELERARAAITKARSLEVENKNPLPLTTASRDAAIQVAHLLWFDSVLRAHDKDFDGALHSISAQMHVSRSIPPDEGIVGFLDQVRVRNMATSALERTLAQGEIPSGRLSAIQKLLEDAARAPLIRLALRTERARYHDALHLISTGKMTVKTLIRTYSDPKRLTWADNFIDHVPGSMIPQAQVWYLRGYGEFIETTYRPLHDAGVGDVVKKWERNGNDTPRLVQLLGGFGYIWLAKTAGRDDAKLACTFSAVAAERFRLEHKRWPHSLAELVNVNLLSDIPLDPIDGQPLRFRSTNDGIVIYSIASDKKNEGKPRDDERKPVEDDNFDYSVGSYEFRLWNPDRRGQPARVKSKLEKKKAD